MTSDSSDKQAQKFNIWNYFKKRLNFKASCVIWLSQCFDLENAKNAFIFNLNEFRNYGKQTPILLNFI